MDTSAQKISSQFAKDVDEGLSAKHKHLSSRYFYDAIGDKIFQKIMQMPEYYLTDCEYEIFDLQKAEILSQIQPEGKFDLVELGAGDGYKTKLLLDYFLKQNANFEYFPVDISKDVLQGLETDLNQLFPDLKVTTLNHEYFSALERLNDMGNCPKVVLFLGSNIGNFSPELALSFFKELNDTLRVGDKLLIGVDLKKDPRTILQAYNDPAGITRSFNLNLLTRMNNELGANFKLENWDHYPNYDPFTGECRSYLMSTVDQDVHIEALQRTYSFKHSEPIHMEISRKYSLENLEEVASKTGFNVQKHFLDSRQYFVDSLWEKA